MLMKQVAGRSEVLLSSSKDNMCCFHRDLQTSQFPDCVTLRFYYFTFGKAGWVSEGKVSVQCNMIRANFRL